MNYKNISDLSKDIDSILSIITEQKFDLVVGIPRSGMLPASMIALKLNLPLMTLTEWISNSENQHGITRKTSAVLKTAHCAEKVLVVDDSVATGNTLRLIREKIPSCLLKRASFFAAYSYSKVDNIDFYAKQVDPPRVFEWNFMHHSILSQSCVDIDGVLCLDPNPNEDDDGPNYINFIRNVSPLYIPTVKVGRLVTNRLEKYRTETALWLMKHGVMYDELAMLNLDTKYERVNQIDYHAHKILSYTDSRFELFIESSFDQAFEIACRTGKPVLCIENNEMIYPGKHTTRQLIKTSSVMFRHRLHKSSFLYKILSYIYKKIK
jgi:uncharacterized HAD superfamily protein/adenine/guanine phosphoribosyltransferase-like PRPP-binding protein